MIGFCFFFLLLFDPMQDKRNTAEMDLGHSVISAALNLCYRKTPVATTVRICKFQMPDLLFFPNANKNSPK